MRIAGIIQDSIVDGPGLRFTLFTQGCQHSCPGCHNPETHDLNGGYDMSVEEIIGKMLGNPLTDGLTLTGGEPFSQADDCAAIAAAAKKSGLNVWCYTGYTFEELLSTPEARVLLELLDVLVDGKFLLDQRTLSLKWRGSHNQRVVNVQKSLEISAPVLYDI